MDDTIYRVLSPYKGRVILCLETAADYMMLSNGVVYQDRFRVFATAPIRDSDITVFLLSEEEFANKQTIEYAGMACTSPVQTILDLLSYYDIVDDQTIYESLANYYYRHGELFDEIIPLMSEEQLRVFEKYRQDAIDYYTEA